MYNGLSNSNDNLENLDIKHSIPSKNFLKFSVFFIAILVHIILALFVFVDDLDRRFLTGSFLACFSMFLPIGPIWALIIGFYYRKTGGRFKSYIDSKHKSFKVFWCIFVFALYWLMIFGVYCLYIYLVIL